MATFIKCSTDGFTEGVKEKIYNNPINADYIVSFKKIDSNSYKSYEIQFKIALGYNIIWGYDKNKYNRDSDYDSISNNNFKNK